MSIGNYAILHLGLSFARPSCLSFQTKTDTCGRGLKLKSHVKEKQFKETSP